MDMEDAVKALITDPVLQKRPGSARGCAKGRNCPDAGCLGPLNTQNIIERAEF